MKNTFRKAYWAVALLLIMITLGCSGYMIIEGYRFTDAFFMTVITVATVGFREIHPLSDAGKWFTDFLIIFSFGIFAYSVTTITFFVVEGSLGNYYKDRKLRKKIDNIKEHVIVCGYGRNGCQVVQELIGHNVPVVIVENNVQALEKLNELPEQLYVKGDATSDETLDLCNIENAKALITTLPNDADNLFVVLTAREKNRNIKIISRASNDASDKKLRIAGASNVIMPDKIGGQRMAKLVAQPDVVEFLDFIMLQNIGSVGIEEVNCANICDKFNGKSIKDLEKQNDSGSKIVGLKRCDGSFVINPLQEIMLGSDDKIFALGTKSQIGNLAKIIEGQSVIDENI